MEWCKEHWRIFAWAGGCIILGMVIVQFAYPRDRLVPFATIDGHAVGHWQKKDATWQLDNEYAQVKESFYFGDNAKPHTTVKLADIGLTVRNDERVNNFSYPWYFRLIPTSLFWVHAVTGDQGPSYKKDTQKQDAFVKNIVGANCYVKPINAGLKVSNGAITVIPSIPGGECKSSDVTKEIIAIKPQLNEKNIVRIPVTKRPAAITDMVAKDVASTMMTRIGESVVVDAGAQKVSIPQKDLYSWLVFSEDNDRLVATVDETKAKDFFDKNIAPLVLREPGVTTITTRDFMELSRSEGARGQVLDTTKMANNLTEFVNNGTPATVQVAATSPKVVYNRSYSSNNEGLSALMTNFATSHPGTYGVAMYELSGERRRASYNGDASFITASTYKMYVAYSTIKRVDAGTWQWSDANIAGGRNREQCFNDMIIKSDNPCAEALLKAVGYTVITNELKALGLNNTSFISGNTPHSTASDEALFLAQLESGQLPISADGRARLLGAMSHQIFRQGIPAGTKAPVADKVGFLWGLLHDAAIVYSPKGTCVLVILTDNSTWANIADLASQIEALR